MSTLIWKPYNKTARIITTQEAAKLIELYQTKDTHKTTWQEMTKVNLRYGTLYEIKDHEP